MTRTWYLSYTNLLLLFRSYHLSQIEQSGEIHLSDTIRKIRIPSDIWSGEVMMYNLDVVIAG